jgi:hypothetical protein
MKVKLYTAEDTNPRQYKALATTELAAVPEKNGIISYSTKLYDVRLVIVTKDDLRIVVSPHADSYPGIQGPWSKSEDRE